MNLVSNPLGDVRAESDHAMLSQAFFETPDYRTLLESDEKIIVVGRRGTGKSALTYRLSTRWSAVKSNTIIIIAPDEHNTIALRQLLPRLGESFLQTKASVRLIWKYGIVLQAAQVLSTKYKVKEAISKSLKLSEHLAVWGRQDMDFFDKLRNLIKRTLPPDIHPTEAVGHLGDTLSISQLEKELKIAIPEGQKIQFLVDRLDEGFEPDEKSIAFMDGMISALSDISAGFKNKIRPIAFLRDNIFRAVAHYDQDFSRNIEAFTLRLHWEVPTLFYMVAERIRSAFLDSEKNTKRLWNKHVEFDLQNEEGFKKCLSLTLYRPRDILILLNAAFESANRRKAEDSHLAIGIIDLESSAVSISGNRLDDLRKEYRHIFPAIEAVTSAFSGGSPELSVEHTFELLSRVYSTNFLSPEAQQNLAILQQPLELVRSLYSIGFLGVHDKSSATFLFCHDGKKPDVNLQFNDKVLVHPCYWMGLGLNRSTLNPEEAAQIEDEYEIKVLSATSEIRQARLGQMMTEYYSFKTGDLDASNFERWCWEACRVLFAGRLENIELHPNKASVNRRDILGTNAGNSAFWKRVIEDYGTRQVIFEVKNYSSPSQTDYRQIPSYLSGKHGNIGFIICRDEKIELERDKELSWVRAVYHENKKLIVKLTGKHLCGLLSKQRNLQKHDSTDQSLATLLDTYERLYLSFPSARKR